jgi:hypothetical protein
MFIPALVLLFILRLRFPKNKPITNTIYNKYGAPTVQLFWKNENILRKHDKLKCDLQFLDSCFHYQVTPKFLRMKLYKRAIENSSLCKSWQRKLLNNELQHKRRDLRNFENQLNTSRNQLKTRVSAIDFACLNLWLLNKQNKANDKTRSTHRTKLHKLGISPIACDLDASKVIHNLSNKVLSCDEKRILLLGLDFALPFNRLNYAKYFLIFEQFYNQVIQKTIFDFMENSRTVFKNQLRTIASKYFYNFKPHQVSNPLFSRKDFKILKNLSNDGSIYITRPDKGAGVVILNREDYVKKVEDIINDRTKFKKMESEEKKLVVKLEDKLNNVLRTLKKANCITEIFYSKCFSSGSQIGSLYGLPKIHKSKCPIRPIVSAFKSHNFNLGKQLLPLISHLSTNTYSLQNSYDFSTTIQNIPEASKLFMCSLDIQSLYTNVPVKETIEIILSKLYDNNSIALYEGFSEQQFKKLLELSLQDTYFRFNKLLYNQTEGLAMGSALSPVVANIFLTDFERKHLDTCPIEFKPLFYRRYLDDTFILFKSELQSVNFFQYFNSRHPQICFTKEDEQENKLSFLDVTVTRTGNSFNTSVFRKDTFTGLGTNYFSNIYHRYKISSFYTLIHRAFLISSSFASFHNEISFLRSFAQNNCFPIKTFNFLVKRFLDNRYSNRLPILTASKDRIYLQLPFIGSKTTKMKNELQLLLTRFFPQCHPFFYFRSSCKIGSFFPRGDQPEVPMRSHVVYKYTCDCCQQSYIGSTMLQMFVRTSRHQGRSFRTGALTSKPENSSIRDHSLKYDHPLKSSNFNIIGNVNDKFDLRVLESIHIHQFHPQMNDNQSAVPLHIVP